MGMTMTEQILARASSTPSVKPGDVAVVDVETAVLMDMTFLPEGWREVLKVHDPAKVAIIFDHLVPAPTVQAATAQRIGRQFAQRFGIERLHDVGATTFLELLDMAVRIDAAGHHQQPAGVQ